MSRCFPFPPPGYEKKSRLEDTNALKEEKKKEKKHKEKKDKEKREGREKRDKERSDDKHREKKDRKEKHKKEKHRDRKKDKEKGKGKNKEKGSNSETSGIASVPETKNTDKRMDQTFFSFSTFSDCQNEEKTIPSNLLYRDTDNARFVQELSRRTKDEIITTNQLEGFLAADDSMDERERNPVRGPGNFAEDNGKDNHRHVDHKNDEKGIMCEVGFRGNSTVQSFARTWKSNNGDLPPSKSIGELLLPSNNIGELPRTTGDMDKRMEGKEKAKGENGKPRNKHKDKDREKKSHRKDKDSEKKTKKVEKPTDKKEDKNTEPDKSININQSDFLVRKNGPDNLGNGSKSYPVGFTEVTGSVPLSDQRSLSIVEGNQKKRKEIDINGFLYENEGRANKLLRPSPQQSLENGRKFEAHQSPILFTSEKHGHMKGVAPDLKMDNKEHSKNGFVESKLVPILGLNLPVLNDQAIEKSRKPAHPDMKFLSQILTVPKMDELCGHDDQEWLFSSKDPPCKKHDVGSVGVGEDFHVWSEAVNIESTDIVALPYVLPY